MSVLEEIVEHKRSEVMVRRERLPLAKVRAAAESAPRPRDFVAAISMPGLSVIAEIKRRSPARGDLRADLDPAALAQRYAGSGASALSVLTDARYFLGSDEDLRLARSVVDLPTLRKDFTVDEYQVFEARALGADAVLLIVRALSDAQLRQLLDLTSSLQLPALVEVHDEVELERALKVGAKIVGVNNRNLDSLSVDLATSFRLRSLIPVGILTVSESGIRRPEDARELAAVGFDAILVGEALVTAPDPAALLTGLRGASAKAVGE